MTPGEVPLRLVATEAAGVAARCLCGTARPAASRAALLAMATHAATCRAGRKRAMTGAPPLTGELPLRVTLRRGGVILACWCGAEAAVIRRSTPNKTMTGLRGSGAAMPHTSADLSPAGLERMTVHTSQCPVVRAVTERLSYAG